MGSQERTRTMEPSYAFKPETAASCMTGRVPVAGESESIGAVLERLPGHVFDLADYLYIKDEAGRLRGLIALTDLLSYPQDRLTGDMMTADPPSVLHDEDQERVVGLAVDKGLISVPVVDGAGLFLGAVPGRALIQILRCEHVEDLHRLTGIMRENAQACREIEAPPVRRAADRLPWLLVGLLGSFIATFVMSRFEQTLQARISVSFFIPAIVYLADAIGTQTETIAVRGLSLSHASFRSSLFKELQTGSMIGLCLAGCSFPAILLVFGDFRLACAVSVTITIAGTIATGIGLLFPSILSHLGKDPAFGSGPVATIVQDVLSLITYFVVVRILAARGCQYGSPAA